VTKAFQGVQTLGCVDNRVCDSEKGLDCPPASELRILPGIGVSPQAVYRGLTFSEARRTPKSQNS
jgi:hypothetical protein